MDGSQRLVVRAGGAISATEVLITGVNPQPGSWRAAGLEEGSSAVLQDRPWDMAASLVTII